MPLDWFRYVVAFPNQNDPTRWYLSKRPRIRVKERHSSPKDPNNERDKLIRALPRYTCNLEILRLRVKVWMKSFFIPSMHCHRNILHTKNRTESQSSLVNGRKRNIGEMYISKTCNFKTRLRFLHFMYIGCLWYRTNKYFYPCCEFSAPKKRLNNIRRSESGKNREILEASSFIWYISS